MVRRRDPEWLGGGIVATDLAESYRAGLHPHLDHAVRVADPFHVVRVANRCVDRVRRNRTGASNGPTEAMNLCVKKVKRAGNGVRTFGHYRLRVLLHTGGVTWPKRPCPPPIRTRSPQLNALCLKCRFRAESQAPHNPSALPIERVRRGPTRTVRTRHLRPRMTA
jgi:hypothetical protein